MPKFQVRSVIAFIFLLSASFLLLFMNCSLDEGGILRQSTTEIPVDYTENPRKIPDPDDPATKNDIVWPDNAGDVSEWERTSKITNVDIKTDNGQICITHTKAGQWNPTVNANSKSVDDPVEGNPWIIVPLKGKAYAATYDWLGKAEPCHMLDVENLKNLYEQLPQRTKVSALSSWRPQPGDRIGFMVSGLARDDRENVRERSNMLVVTLPDADGKVPQDTCSQSAEETESQSTTTSVTTTASADTDADIPACSEDCNVPNRITIVDGIASQHQDALNKADALNTERVSSGSVKSDDERWEFMDRVVQALHAQDDRFGYKCINEDCDNISTNEVAYKCEEEDSETEDNIAAVGIFKQGGTTQWPDPEADQEDGWKYPRAENIPDYNQPSGNNSQCANDSNAPESQLAIVRQVAAATDNLYKTSPDGFTQKVVECLKDIDANWGRRLNDDSGVLSNDTVAYRMEGSTIPYSIDIIADARGSNPTLAWNIQSHNGQCGQVGGQWSEVQGNCTIELEGHCTKAQINSGNYGTIDGQCFPKCDAFEESNATGVTIGKGEECNDTTDYNILPIKNTYEEKSDGSQCCRRSNKKACGTGYMFLTDNCYPSCNTAAVRLAGYENSNYFQYSNGNALEEFFTLTTSDCEDLSHGGSDHWIDFEFYDPYRFKLSKSTEDVSVCKLHSCPERRGCCVKQTAAPSLEVLRYDLNGWSKNDRDRLSTTTSSNTTTTSSSTTSAECTTEIDCINHPRCSMSASTEIECVNGRCTCN